MKGTVNLMLGSNPKDKREENDFYADRDLLLSTAPKDTASRIIEI